MIHPKITNVLECLERIAKVSGEEEFQAIIELEKKDIFITNKKGIPFGYNQKSLFILVPYNIKNYNSLKQAFLFQAPEYLSKKYIKKIKKDNKKYFSYPYSIFITDNEIEKKIYQELKDLFNIEYSNVSFEEWGDIRNTKQWKQCIEQILRESIAIEIIENLGINW